MTTGDYCPRCRGIHDILKDCPAVIPPYAPASTPEDPRAVKVIADMQKELDRLNLQIDDLKDRHGKRLNLCRYCLTTVWEREQRAADGNSEEWFHPPCKVAKERADAVRLNGEYRKMLETLEDFGLNAGNWTGDVGSSAWNMTPAEDRRLDQLWDEVRAILSKPSEKRTEPMQMNRDPKWIERMAKIEMEAGGNVSAGCIEKRNQEVGHCMKCSKVLHSAYGWCAECYKAFGGVM